MKYQPIEDIEAGAALTLVEAPVLSRTERLERWAELLEQKGQEPLQALWRVEFMDEGERARTRAANSPISVAFADPDLRAAGLTGDTLGEARDFFELTWDQAHHLLCDCHYMGRMDGRTVARRVRSVAHPTLATRLFG
jgi:CheY-like chemotaxis protein